LATLKGISFQQKSLPNNFSVPSFSLFLIIEEINGCAPGVVLGIKYDEATTGLGVEDADGEEPLPLSRSPPHLLFDSSELPCEV